MPSFSSPTHILVVRMEYDENMESLLLIRNSIPNRSVSCRRFVELVFESLLSIARAMSIYYHVLFESLFSFPLIRPKPRVKLFISSLSSRSSYVCVFVCVKRKARDRINCACEKYDRQRRRMTKEGKIQKIWEFLILVQTSRRRDDSMMDSNIFRRWVLLVNAYVYIFNRTCGVTVGTQCGIFSTCIRGVSLFDSGWMLAFFSWEI